MPVDFGAILGWVAIAIVAVSLIYTLLTQKRQHERFQQRFTVPQEDGSAKGIVFRGTVTPEIRALFRSLYCTQDLWVPIVYSMLALVSIVAAVIFALGLLGSRTASGDPPVAVLVIVVAAFLSLAGVALFITAFALPQICWSADIG